jgi:hypothetical protein
LGLDDETYRAMLANVVLANPAAAISASRTAEGY